MNINATLVVQVFHFCIAYGMIKKFFLRPFMQVINHEDAQLLELRTAITQEKVVLERARDYKEERWQECQRYFYEHAPSVDQAYMQIGPAMPREKLEARGDLCDDSCVREVTQHLVQKVRDAGL